VGRLMSGRPAKGAPNQDETDEREGVDTMEPGRE